MLKFSVLEILAAADRFRSTFLNRIGCCADPLASISAAILRCSSLEILIDFGFVRFHLVVIFLLL